MKKALSLLALISLALPLQSQAKPVSVTMYPQGAMVTEEEVFRPGQGRIILSLPAGADAESLSVSLSAGTVQESRMRIRNTPSPAMKKLQKERDEVQSGLARVAAERENISFERLFWAEPPVTVEGKNKKELHRQAKETQERLAAIADRDVALDSRQRELERRLRVLESRMESLGRHNDAVQECVLVLEGEEPVTVRWTYFLAGASWQPRYRVLAGEKDQKARVLMDAVLRQTSGADWKGVNVTLSGADTSGRVSPPALPDWIIKDTLPVMRSANLMAAKAVADAAPVQEYAAGTLWNLGKVDVPAEGSLTRPVSSHEFSASFFRLARPALEEKVWLAAEIRDDDIPVLPAGQALFLVDGMENARGVFSLEPGRKELFFGVDQLVSVSERNLPVSAAPATDEGMTVRRWKKSVDIRNGHDRSVTVRVEAASPIVRDASTQVAFTAEPEAKSGEDGAFRFWNIEVPAKKNSGIVYEVTVTEPDDNASAGNEKN